MSYKLILLLIVFIAIMLGLYIRHAIKVNRERKVHDKLRGDIRKVHDKLERDGFFDRVHKRIQDKDKE